MPAKFTPQTNTKKQPNFLHLDLQYASSSVVDGIAAKHATISSSTGSLSLCPTIPLAIVDHFLRQQVNTASVEEDGLSFNHVFGLLLGGESEVDGSIHARHALALLPAAADSLAKEETTQIKTGKEITVDEEYFAQVISLHSKSNRSDSVIGWYYTGPSLPAHAAQLHAFFEKQVTALSERHAVLLLVDTTLSNKDASMRAFTSSAVGMPLSEAIDTPPGFLFVQIPCAVKPLPLEQAALTAILAAKASPNAAPSRITTSTEALESAITKLRDLLGEASVYVAAVLADKNTATRPNTEVGRFLMDTLAAIPQIDQEEFEGMFNRHVNDVLMVDYLANLTKVQLSITERLYALKQ